MKIYNPRHLLNHLTTAVIQDFVVTRDYGDAIQVDWSLKDNELRKALDTAIERAILKSSPLPKPDDPSLFQRELTIKYKPFEE